MPGAGADSIRGYSLSDDGLAVQGSSYGGLAPGALDPALFSVGTASGPGVRFVFVPGQVSVDPVTFVRTLTKPAELRWDADGSGQVPSVLLATFDAVLSGFGAGEIQVIG
jgi:hypothetical protein